MPFIAVTPEQRTAMFQVLGIKAMEELFRELPEGLRFPELSLDEGLSELEVIRELSALAEKNTPTDTCRWFLGAGAYDHFIPAAVGALASRSEFTTAYTPYQSEVSQGTLQSIFEYQSMIAELTGMEVVNAGHYDGATALAEGVLMALKNNQGRKRVLLPSGLHPEYRLVLDTYLGAFEPVIETYTGSPAVAASAGSSHDLACLVSCYPDFFGCIPDLEGAAPAIHNRGGIFIVHGDPIMWGLFKSPGSFGADLVTAEGQSLGNELNYGGPFLGIMAASRELMRRIPGRIAGEARDSQGRRGYVLTLSAREQHIRREKAVSNICSNQGLAMLRACIYLALTGKQGLRAIGELCWHKSHYAAAQIAGLKGFQVAAGAFFKEFLVTLPGNAEEAAEKLFQNRIVPGLPLSRYYPDRPKELLVCVTEKNTREDIDALVRALEEVYR
ncbi:MAG: aminomethyl-transferring glycine dehydrogenase subunit GcvPA [Treponema sp.]|jgi:glycine dehydrogenase subunit 1|nr:aminomethyl-transferring glycine dehydrogenase subunit GcvPA [Treponema sp.]